MQSGAYFTDAVTELGAALKQEMYKCCRRPRVILVGDMGMDWPAMHIREDWASTPTDRAATLLQMIVDCELRGPSSCPYEDGDRQWTHHTQSGREWKFDQVYSNEPFDCRPVTMKSEAKASAVMKFSREPKVSSVRWRPIEGCGAPPRQEGAPWGQRSIADVHTAIGESALQELQARKVGERPEPRHSKQKICIEQLEILRAPCRSEEGPEWKRVGRATRRVTRRIRTMRTGERFRRGHRAGRGTASCARWWSWRGRGWPIGA